MSSNHAQERKSCELSEESQGGPQCFNIQERTLRIEESEHRIYHVLSRRGHFLSIRKQHNFVNSHLKLGFGAHEVQNIIPCVTITFTLKLCNAFQTQVIWNSTNMLYSSAQLTWLEIKITTPLYCVAILTFFFEQKSHFPTTFLFSHVVYKISKVALITRLYLLSKPCLLHPTIWVFHHTIFRLNLIWYIRPVAKLHLQTFDRELWNMMRDFDHIVNQHL